MDIKEIEKDKYKTYEELLVKRDELLNEIESIEIAYKKEFGKEEIKLFEKEIECIKYKKIITYLQNLINHEKQYDIEILNAEISKQMLIYKDELNARILELKRVDESKTVDVYAATESKKIYRKIVKVIHPDINPFTYEKDDLKELWEDVYDAYRKYDYKILLELEVITNKMIEKYNLKVDFSLVIDDIDSKISSKEEEIATMLQSVPYIYKDLLSDEETVKKKHNDITTEMDKYDEYIKELKENIEKQKLMLKQYNE